MTDKMEDALKKGWQSAQKMASDGYNQVRSAVTPPAPESPLAKAANEAMEYIREMLKSGAALATTAVEGAVEMGKDAYEYLNKPSTPANPKDTARNPNDTTNVR